MAIAAQSMKIKSLAIVYVCLFNASIFAIPPYIIEEMKRIILSRDTMALHYLIQDNKKEIIQELIHQASELDAESYKWVIDELAEQAQKGKRKIVSSTPPSTRVKTVSDEDELLKSIQEGNLEKVQQYAPAIFNKRQFGKLTVFTSAAESLSNDDKVNDKKISQYLNLLLKMRIVRSERPALKPFINALQNNDYVAMRKIIGELGPRYLVYIKELLELAKTFNPELNALLEFIKEKEKPPPPPPLPPLLPLPQPKLSMVDQLRNSIAQGNFKSLQQFSLFLTHLHINTLNELIEIAKTSNNERIVNYLRFVMYWHQFPTKRTIPPLFLQAILEQNYTEILQQLADAQTHPYLLENLKKLLTQASSWDPTYSIEGGRYGESAARRYNYDNLLTAIQQSEVDRVREIVKSINLYERTINSVPLALYQAESMENAPGSAEDSSNREIITKFIREEAQKQLVTRSSPLPNQSS